MRAISEMTAGSIRAQIVSQLRCLGRRTLTGSRGAGERRPSCADFSVATALTGSPPVQSLLLVRVVRSAVTCRGSACSVQDGFDLLRVVVGDSLNIAARREDLLVE